MSTPDQRPDGEAELQLCWRWQRKRQTATKRGHSLGRTAQRHPTPERGGGERSGSPRRPFSQASAGEPPQLAGVTAREGPSYHAEVAARSPRWSEPDEPGAPGARSAGRRPRHLPPRRRPISAPLPARGAGRERAGRRAAHPRTGRLRGGAPAAGTPATGARAASRLPGRGSSWLPSAKVRKSRDGDK